MQEHILSACPLQSHQSLAISSHPFLQFVDHEAQGVGRQCLNHLLHHKVAMHMTTAIEPQQFIAKCGLAMDCATAT